MGTRFDSCRSERWLIRPLSCPRPIRYCPACGVAKEFVCSERFRVNAQKKVIDVWLHYRCSDCGGAWKFPVLERQSVTRLDAGEYEAYVRHDPAMVWQHAFDARMRSHVLRIATTAEIVVERTVVSGPADAATVCIVLDAPFACDIRLDRLLATTLGVSRAAIQHWYKQGQLRVCREGGGALSKRLRSGQRVLLSGPCGAHHE